MLSIVIQIVTALVQAYGAYQQASDAEKAALEAQANAALAALKGAASSAKVDHEERTAETIKEIG